MFRCNGLTIVIDFCYTPAERNILTNGTPYRTIDSRLLRFVDKSAALLYGMTVAPTTTVLIVASTDDTQHHGSSIRDHDSNILNTSQKVTQSIYCIAPARQACKHIVRFIATSATKPKV